MRGAQRPAQEHTGTDFFTALIGLVGRNKRRYGGYIVHLGIVLIFLGFAGNGYKKDEQVLLKPGQEATVGRFTRAPRRAAVTDDGQKQMITAHIDRVRGRQADRHDVSGEVVLPQARGRADDRGRDPPRASPKISTSCSPAFDLQDADGQPADRREPAGQLDLARVRRAGARHRHRAAARARVLVRAREAARRGGRRRPRLLLVLVLLLPAVAHAQHVENAADCAGDRRAPRSSRSCSTRSVCICGTCGHKPLSASARAAMPRKMRDETRDSSSTRARPRGDHRLLHREVRQPGDAGARRSTGFNRLAWLFPYLLGATGAARRRLRRHALVAPRETATAPPRPPPPSTGSRTRRAPRR